MKTEKFEGYINVEDLLSAISGWIYYYPTKDIIEINIKQINHVFNGEVVYTF